MKVDYTKLLPSGHLDDTTYQQIEEVLDRAYAPCCTEDGKWLSLAQRVATLRAKTGIIPIDRACEIIGAIATTAFPSSVFQRCEEAINTIRMEAGALPEPPKEREMKNLAPACRKREPKPIPSKEYTKGYDAFMRAAIEAALEAERAACAKIAEATKSYDDGVQQSAGCLTTGERIATAIRNRKGARE